MLLFLKIRRNDNQIKDNDSDDSWRFCQRDKLCILAIGEPELKHWDVYIKFACLSRRNPWQNINLVILKL